jgi:hypothetical protein
MNEIPATSFYWLFVTGKDVAAFGNELIYLKNKGLHKVTLYDSKVAPGL